MFDIRIANISDEEFIQQIYGAFTGADADQPHWDQLIADGGVMVAESAGKIIGFGGIDVKAAEQLKWLYLLPELQGSGVGSEMLQRLEQIGWDAGLSAIRLHSAPGAVEFYQKHGYTEVESDHQLGHDHDGLEMMKERRSVGGDSVMLL
jgi:GNAT superfamily N-acetyltransferase